MKLFEALFDILYLGVVIGLGIRLVLERNRNAKLFGLMAILLGSGDAFHLLPRVVSYLTVNGFEKNTALLSWGEFAASITMTIFYVLFYHYYAQISGEGSEKKRGLIYLLALIRIGIVILPQNLWGTSGDYLFGILRNVPFLIMGILLICWTYKFRRMEGLRHCSLLIFLSFLFYIPVVAGARFIPVLGALMIPKTVAYVLLVAVGFRHFIRGFDKENLLKTSITFLILGLLGGVFYREFTKAWHFAGETTLSLVHLHVIVLGFLFLLVIYSIVKDRPSDMKNIGRPLLFYFAGLSWTVTTFVVKGINMITAGGRHLYPAAAFSGVAGIGHIVLGCSMVMIMLRMAASERSAA